VQKMKADKTDQPLRSSPGQYDPVWGMTIHGNGDVIDPTQDRRFTRKSWASKSRGSWADRSFSKPEIESILRDLVNGC